MLKRYISSRSLLLLGLVAATATLSSSSAAASLQQKNLRADQERKRKHRQLMLSNSRNSTGFQALTPATVPTASPTSKPALPLTKPTFFQISKIERPTRSPTPGPTQYQNISQSTTTTTPIPTNVPSSIKTCSNLEENKYWIEEAFPEFASRTKCTLPEDCVGIPDSCCLVDFCFCGRYVPAEKDQACLAAKSEQENETIEKFENNTGLEGGPADWASVVPSENATVVAATVQQPTSKPTTQSSLKPTKQPTLKPTLKPTSIATPSPTTAVPTFLPTTQLPTTLPTSKENPTTSALPEFDLRPYVYKMTACSSRDNMPFWDIQKYPQYAEDTRCFYSEECTENSNACCLAERCLCGIYQSQADECVPYIEQKTNINQGRSIDSASSLGNN